MGYRLEYNESQKQFHYAMVRNEQTRPNTFGWATIADDEADYKLMIFTQYIMAIKYASLPSLNEVKKEWNAFNFYATQFMEAYATSQKRFIAWISDYETIPVEIMLAT